MKDHIIKLKGFTSQGMSYLNMWLVFDKITSETLRSVDLKTQPHKPLNFMDRCLI